MVKSANGKKQRKQPKQPKQPNEMYFFKASYHRPKNGNGPWVADFSGDLRILEYLKGNKDGSSMYVIVFNGLGGKDLLNSPIAKGMPFGRLNNTFYMKTNVVTNQGTTKGRFPFALDIPVTSWADTFEKYMEIFTQTKNCFRTFQGTRSTADLMRAADQQIVAAASSPRPSKQIIDRATRDYNSFSRYTCENENPFNIQHVKEEAEGNVEEETVDEEADEEIADEEVAIKEEPTSDEDRKKKATGSRKRKRRQTTDYSEDESDSDSSCEKQAKRKKKRVRIDFQFPDSEDDESSSDEENDYEKYEGSPIQSQRQYWY